MTKHLLLVFLVVVSAWTVAYCSDLLMEPSKAQTIIREPLRPLGGMAVERPQEPVLVIKYSRF